jgi:hypothetical protein
MAENFVPRDFQTRNDVGIIRVFPTFMEAYQAWKQDPTIWKISFNDNDGIPMRWVVKTKADQWENEDVLLGLNPEYANNPDRHAIYWVFQSMRAHNERAIRQQIVEELIAENEGERLIDRARLLNILSDMEFVNQFRMY